MANDKGGKAKTLFSIDDGAGNPINPTDLLNVDGLVNGISAWETTSGGNSFRINNGKIELNLDATLAALGGSINSMAAGDHIHDTFTYAIRLGNGTLSWATVTFDLYGQNDAATISGDVTGTLAEDDTSAVTGTLTVVDPDHDESFTQSVLSGATLAGLGTYSVDADGNWSYSVDNAAVQYLADGETATDSFVVVSADGTVSQAVNITITGEDEAPVITDISVSGNPNSIGASDFNGDGIIDLVFTRSSASSIGVLIGNGDGTFGAMQTFATEAVPTVLSIADFNGDGYSDVAMGSYTLVGDVSVLLGNGDGTFAPHQSIDIGHSFEAAVVSADFNGDTFSDMVVTDNWISGVAVLLGNGDGTFQPPQSYSAGVSSTGVAIGDLNGDSVLDLAIGNYFSNDTTIMLGNGDGTFTFFSTLAVSGGTSTVQIADLDNDGNVDLLAASYNSNSLVVYLGNGDGTFAASTSYATGAGPHRIALGDLNGDSVLDAAVANNGSGNVSILFGDGAGGFSPQLLVATGTGPSGVAIEDFNGDGDLDIAVNNDLGNSITILLNDWMI